MQAREAEGAEAEGRDGDAGLDPARSRGRVDDAEPEVDRVARLHGHEGAPDEDAGAVEQARDDVAGQQDQVGPGAPDVGRHVPVEAVVDWEGGFARGADDVAGQERCFFVLVDGGRSEGAAVCAGVFEARHVGRLAFGEARCV